YRQFGDSTPRLIVAAGVILAVLAALVSATWPVAIQAIRLYRRAWPALIVIGALLIPIGLLFNGLQFLVTRLPPGSIVMTLLENTPGAYYAVALLLLIFQQLASLVVISPMVAKVYEDLQENRRPHLRDIWSRTQPHIPDLLRAI